MHRHCDGPCVASEAVVSSLTVAGARDVAHLHDRLGMMETDQELSGLDIVWALESALLPTVVKMEATGIRVERTKLEAISSATPPRPTG